MLFDVRIKMKRLRSNVVLIAAALSVGCSSRDNESTQKETIDEMPISQLEDVASTILEDGAASLAQVDRSESLGETQEYMLVYNTDSKIAAERFVYSYGHEFMKLLKRQKGTTIGLGTKADEANETASIFNATFKRSDKTGFIDVFMFQRADEKFNVRIIFFESR